jgi:type II restriction/modification system DNA methylase subunit YeeA
MTPEEFITTWTANDLTERAGAQAFIEDLCELLRLEKPRDSETFCYEKGAVKDSGRRGWADVWKKDHFAWENKKPRSDLKRALAQLREYSGNLENPPLLIVCDRERIEIHTVFRGFPDEPRTILLSEIGDAKNLEILRWVFTDPDKLKPLKSNAAITAEAAAKFAYLAGEMRKRGLNPQVVAHFLTQCVFCMFAEDEELLHVGYVEDKQIFTSLLRVLHNDPIKAVKRMTTLFHAMQKKGSSYGNDDIAWFNGGLFKIIDVPPINQSELRVLFAATRLDWRAIDPTIFGTLFERGLDPSNRAQLGAHYTDVSTINKLIEPLIIRPLAAKWQAVRVLLEKSQNKGIKSNDYKNARTAYQAYLDELHHFRVLDAACGSGNFLYLALHALKDLEHRAQLDAEILGFEKQIIIGTGTHNVLGIETNEYAAELARVTVWIGDIQWCQRNGRPINKNPILSSLDGIEHRDALINPYGTEAQWPEADVIVGNPPFLGQRFQLKELKQSYLKTLRTCYEGRVSGNGDLVCYWFDKARTQIEQGKAKAAGLVSTNSIRGGANREVLDAIVKTMPIFEAWADEEWFDKGTAVRVSLVCFGNNSLETKYLNGQPIALIHTSLTGVNDLSELDVSRAKSLEQNVNTAYSGFQMNGAFDIDGDIAREWLKLANFNNLSNSKVLRPYVNARDMVARDRGKYVIDFTGMTKDEASLFETPFNWVEKEVRPKRLQKREKNLQINYWLHKRSSPSMHKAVGGLKRFIATPMVSKYRIFVWLPEIKTPENAAIVIARADDTTFGILHSRFHELWSLALCSSLEDRPRYTPTTCFETFPFPTDLTPADTNNSESKIAILDFSKPTPAPVTNPEIMIHAQAIAAAAFKLNDYREKWLNPPEWVDWVITPEEEAAGFPKRPKAKPGQEANLKKRTLTNLYNARPAWLNFAHQELDKAVAAAYGWQDYTPEMTDAEILQRLLKLNIERNSAS